jgi:hypothetical protein
MLLMLGVVAAACQGSPQPLDLPVPSVAASAVSPADPEQAPFLAPSAAPTIQFEPTQPAAPTIRTELAATDPATVNLASGQPTLVEFFAFW